MATVFLAKQISLDRLVAIKRAAEAVLRERELHRAVLQGREVGGPAQPSQHRAGLRRGAGRGPPLLRHGVRRGRDGLRPDQGGEAARGARCHRHRHPVGPGTPARPRAWLHPPRHQAQEHHAHRAEQGEAGRSRTCPPLDDEATAKAEAGRPTARPTTSARNRSVARSTSGRPRTSTDWAPPATTWSPAGSPSGKNPSQVMHKHLKAELTPDQLNPSLSAGFCRSSR